MTGHVDLGTLALCLSKKDHNYITKPQQWLLFKITFSGNMHFADDGHPDTDTNGHPERPVGEVRQTSCTKKTMESNEVSLPKIQVKSNHIHQI